MVRDVTVHHPGAFTVAGARSLLFAGGLGLVTVTSAIPAEGGIPSPPTSPGIVQQTAEQSVAQVSSQRTLTLPAGYGMYFYLASTAGGQPVTNVSWQQDESVVARYSGNVSISIGHSTRSTGSYATAAGVHAMGGVALPNSGYLGVYTRGVSRLGPGESGGGTAKVDGPSLDLPFGVSRGNLVLLLVGGEGTGYVRVKGLPRSGIKRLGNRTFHEAGSKVLASVAMFLLAPPEGFHVLRINSTTTGNNSGTSLGAAAYVITPSRS